jgi:hypothetical protein
MGVLEASVISTCNRTEVYCCVEAGAEAIPAEWLAAQHQIDLNLLRGSLYQHVDGAAVRHLFRVATGTGFARAWRAADPWSGQRGLAVLPQRWRGEGGAGSAFPAQLCRRKTGAHGYPHRRAPGFRCLRQRALGTAGLCRAFTGDRAADRRGRDDRVDRPPPGGPERQTSADRQPHLRQRPRAGPALRGAMRWVWTSCCCIYPRPISSFPRPQLPIRSSVAATWPSRSRSAATARC